MSDLRAWAQLVRVPNTLTACADVLAGMCLAGGVSDHFGRHGFSAVIASLASICFYWAGMVLNDVFDIDLDRESRRPGPLVTGKIAIATATRAGILLLICGILGSVVAPLGISSFREQATWARLTIPGLVGGLLALAVWAYDGPCKKSPLAPVIMGLCRSCNMALGIAVIAAAIPLAISWAAAAVVAGHGVYVTGLTIAARREADLTQSRGRLLWGWGICFLGAALIALSPRLDPLRPYRLEPLWVFPLLIGILLLPLARRVFDALTSLAPQRLGLAIRQAIFTILFLDAAVALQYAGDIPGICIALMVVPTLLLARWFRST